MAGAWRDVLRGAIESLRPGSGQPDLADDRWRLFLILTEQYIEGQAPDYVADQLNLAQRTYHHGQAHALDSLAALLREQEESVSLIYQGQLTVAATSTDFLASCRGRRKGRSHWGRDPDDKVSEG